MALNRRSLLLSSAMAPLAGAWGSSLPRLVRIPHVSARAELERSYPAQLLAQALAAAGVPVTLEPTPELVPQNRALQELGRRRSKLDVVWTMTSAEREKQALAVRVPIFKGLYGWRLMLAVPEVAERLRGVKDLAELKQFSMVQGLDWPDTGILQANGIKVVVSPNYEAMFKQLRLGRVDAFPRSVEEIWWEVERYGQGLVIVPDIVLHYPAPIYFFVGPDDAPLASAIYVGLQRLRADGSFDRLFMKHHGDDLARAKLGSRRIISMANPLLPPDAQLHPDMWYRP